MRWENNPESEHVEDRRGAGGSRIGARSLGIGTVLIAVVASYFLGVDPGTVLSVLEGGPSGVPAQAPARTAPANDDLSRFVRTVLADTEAVWHAQFQGSANRYQEPTLVLFTGSTPTACGAGQAATGPFYCPADRRIYIDLQFYDVMQRRFGVAGDFAQAYVIAHEVGHHVQNLMGIMERTGAVRQRAPAAQANAVSVMVELQADCFAGIWAHHSRIALEEGDVEEALNAAHAVGDDAMQRQGQGTVVPDSFTHGTSAQRMAWFRKGMNSGRVADCNTFDANAG